MSPNKLFDYLDGKLPSNERAEIERRMAEDPSLRRELAMARKLHDGMRNLSEAVGSDAVGAEVGPQGAALGRRILIAVIFLVFVNVCIGLFFVFRSHRQEPLVLPGSSVRQQVEQSAERAADSSLPLPTLQPDEIKMIAPAEQTNALIQKIETAAKTAGGSAAKAIADQDGTIVLADLPKVKVDTFRRALASLGAQVPSLASPAASPSPNEREYLQIRIVTPATESKP